jgi:hypothetical protein
VFTLNYVIFLKLSVSTCQSVLLNSSNNVANLYKLLLLGNTLFSAKCYNIAGTVVLLHSRILTIRYFLSSKIDNPGVSVMFVSVLYS